MNERTDNGLFFQLYPEYSADATSHPNLVCGWSEGVYDLTCSDPQITGMAIRDSIIENYEAQNNTVQKAELISAEILDMDGKKAFRAELHVIVDLSDQAGQERIAEYYQIRVYIADEAFGTYTFTIASDTQENSEACVALLDTLKWTA